MSKIDAMRAMREARYAERQGRGGTSQPARLTRATPSAPEPRATAEPLMVDPLQEDSPGDEALCGHRSMNGRTCTRERGHAAKSHRYG